mmetsp:Transcript_17933/g.31488  ORF Transcript_17933/g.31488 Transcript_17933/m.31488 type:complete len:432 (+) Transcript_17933:101-1396(+)
MCLQFDQAPLPSDVAAGVVLIYPKDIRFTDTEIPKILDDGRNIEHIIAQLRRNSKPPLLPRSLRVFYSHGHWSTLDNVLLYVLLKTAPVTKYACEVHLESITPLPALGTSKPIRTVFWRGTNEVAIEQDLAGRSRVCCCSCEQVYFSYNQASFDITLCCFCRRIYAQAEKLILKGDLSFCVEAESSSTSNPPPAATVSSSGMCDNHKEDAVTAVNDSPTSTARCQLHKKTHHVQVGVVGCVFLECGAVYPASKEEFTGRKEALIRSPREEEIVDTISRCSSPEVMVQLPPSPSQEESSSSTPPSTSPAPASLLLRADDSLIAHHQPPDHFPKPAASNSSCDAIDRPVPLLPPPPPLMITDGRGLSVGRAVIEANGGADDEAQSDWELLGKCSGLQRSSSGSSYVKVSSNSDDSSEEDSEFEAVVVVKDLQI